jgi:hypothetical protein
MSQVNPYASIAKRNFASALSRLLAEEYRFLGGPRIVRLLVEDVQALIAEYYPETSQMSSGSLVWTCTADDGRKAQAGKPTEAYPTVTVRLPLITQEELDSRTGQQNGAHEREKGQVVRLVKAAAEQGGLLTIAELSVIVNRSYEKVRQYVQEWQAETGELLPLKGYRMDQGAKPTHKADIVRLFEQGQKPPDIARRSGHSLKSVERYLQDYERVKLLLKSGHDANAISLMINRGRSVVLEYMKLAQEYHPELFPTALDSGNDSPDSERA